MTIGLVGQDQITTFTSPVNGTSPIDGNVVRGNDNTTKTAFNLHDLDATIHFQSSLNSARPPAGVAGRKWLDADTYRVYYDDGAAWHEVAYIGAGGGVISGPVHVTGSLTVDGALVGQAATFTSLTVTPGPTSLTGNVAISPNVTVTAAAGGNRGMLVCTAGVIRWYLYLDSALEGGGNAGSNFNMTAYSDAGAPIDTPLSIVRGAGGPVTINRPAVVAGTLAVSGTTVIGPDPGGSGILRVGNGARVSGYPALVVQSLAGDAFTRFQMLNGPGGAAGHGNWEIAKSFSVAGALSFTPSTVVDGTTFTTPALTLYPATSGSAVVVGADPGGSATFRVGGGMAATGQVIAAGFNPTGQALLYSQQPAFTGTMYMQIVNAAANVLFGVEGVAGSSLLSGSSPYALVMGQSVARPIEFFTSNAKRLSILATGDIALSNGLSFLGSATLGALEVGKFSFEVPHLRYYIGDGSGYSIRFSKRSGSVTTDQVTIYDSGTVTIAGTLAILGLGAAGGGQLLAGAPDSGGPGFRMLRVVN